MAAIWLWARVFLMLICTYANFLIPDEGSLRIYRTPFTSDYSEPQYFIDEETLRADFWELGGNSVFDPLMLRKSLGIFNDQTESLIFLKLESNPLLKLREAYHQVAEASAERLEAQNTEIRRLRRERRRQRRRIAFQSRVEQMRLAAAREGREFVQPETPPFSDDNDGDELSDIEDMFERIEPRVEAVQQEENNDEFVDPFDSPLSSPASNADRRSGSQRSGSVGRRSGSEPDTENQQLPVGLDMLSDSEADEKPAASDHEEPMNEEGSQTKSPKSDTNENAVEASAESPVQGQLWASSDEEEQPTEQVEQQKTPQPNEDVHMEDLTEENSQHAESN
jgi:hypothetical protein